LASLTVTRTGPGQYRIERDGRTEIVYVAGPPTDRWVFWNGHVFRFRDDTSRRPPAVARVDGVRQQTLELAAPMPARVGRVLISEGMAVRKGDTLLVLEAMKMELPLRAPDDGTVTAVKCSEGDLVQADAVLVEMN
jgi:biotin carboxyl carrier protein